MALTYCPYCHQTAGGEHEQGCPNAPRPYPPPALVRSKIWPAGTEGWICPLCGSVHAPWVPACHCAPSVKVVRHVQATLKGAQEEANDE